MGAGRAMVGSQMGQGVGARSARWQGPESQMAVATGGGAGGPEGRGGGVGG